MRFFINPLSARDQCHSAQEIADVMENLVQCFDYILPALQADRAVLLYDEAITTQSLEAGLDLRSSIAKLRSLSNYGGDLATKWYRYVKQRAEDVTDYGAEVDVSCIDGSFEPVQGTVSSAAMRKGLIWLSFGHTALGEALRFVVKANGDSVLSANAHVATRVAEHLPRYEASDKHRRESYFDSERGEHVAAMPLPANLAQNVLLSGVAYEDDVWSYDHATNSFYRFKRTLRNVFHGFTVEEKEVPAAIRKQLLNN